MCSSPDPAPPPPPPPAAPMTLEQVAPKSAASKTSDSKRKRQGLARYKIDAASGATNAAPLGGIPKKTGV